MSTDRYLGIPWLDRGRTRIGCDCFGLTRLILAEQHGITLDPWATTMPRAELAREIAAQAEPEWFKVDPARARRGDVAVFNVVGHANHCGVMLGSRSFIHVEEGGVSCVEELTAVRWARRLEGIYRHAALEMRL